MADEDDRIRQQGLSLPPLADAVGRFVGGKQAGDLLFLSGAIGTVHNGSSWTMPIRGKIGAEVSIDEAKQSAVYCMLHHLRDIRHIAGSLSRVRQVIKLSGFVNAAPGFSKAPLVLDGASELLLYIFGEERGQHARLAAYQPEMSFDAPIETDLIVQLD